MEVFRRLIPVCGEGAVLALIRSLSLRLVVGSDLLESFGAVGFLADGKFGKSEEDSGSKESSTIFRTCRCLVRVGRFFIRDPPLVLSLIHI